MGIKDNLHNKNDTVVLTEDSDHYKKYKSHLFEIAIVHDDYTYSIQSLDDIDVWLWGQPETELEPPSKERLK